MNPPVMPAMCATCPFRENGWTHVRPLLQHRALCEATPICHSTGEDSLVPSKGPDRLCRGARDWQLQIFAGMGFISEPTDEAWDAKCVELGIEAASTITRTR